MKAVIVGCGRVGAALADYLDQAGHDVTILDRSSAAFDRLPSTFKGNAVRGDGTDEDVLRRAGAEGADLFLALTEGDNRNIMAAQLAAEAFRAGRTIAKVNDPVRAEAYGHLGIATLCRTNLMTDAVLTALGFDVAARPGVNEAAPHAHGTDGRLAQGAEGGAGSAGSEATVATASGSPSSTAAATGAPASSED